jgi:hypothetical protein
MDRYSAKCEEERSKRIKLIGQNFAIPPLYEPSKEWYYQMIGDIIRFDNIDLEEWVSIPTEMETIQTSYAEGRLIDAEKTNLIYIEKYLRFAASCDLPLHTLDEEWWSFQKLHQSPYRCYYPKIKVIELPQNDGGTTIFGERADGTLHEVFKMNDTQAYVNLSAKMSEEEKEKNAKEK